MLKNKKNNQSKLRRAALGVLLVLLAAGLVFAVIKLSSDRKAGVNEPRPANTVNYDKPTEEERQAGEEQKAQNIERQQRDEVSSTPNANVMLADAGTYENVFEVRAYVSNLLEDGGSCTATLTGEAGTYRKAAEAFKDARTTQCGQMTFAAGEIPAGTYEVQVSYKSATANGTSPARSVKVE